MLLIGLSDEDCFCYSFEHDTIIHCTRDVYQRSNCPRFLFYEHRLTMECGSIERLMREDYQYI